MSQAFYRLNPASCRRSFSTSKATSSLSSPDGSAPLDFAEATCNVAPSNGSRHMFDSFRKFLSEASEGGAHPIHFEHDDYRLAAAALLVHAAAIAGDASAAERDQLHAVSHRNVGVAES